MSAGFENALEVRGLYKKFKGRIALDGLSFSIPKRAVAAFVGSNGAGKTTTFSIIGGFFWADRGSIRIHGTALAAYRGAGGIIGFQPQDALFYEHRTVERHLAVFARLAGFWGWTAQREVERVLESVELLERRTSLVTELSHGMRARLGIAQALIGNPPLVLLDEPTNGLDPKMLAVFRSTIERVRGSTTIVMSSHDLSQLQMLCDYVCMVDHGKLVREGPLSEVLGVSSRITFRLESNPPDLEALKQFFPEFTFAVEDVASLVVKFRPDEFEVPEVNSRVLFWLFRHGAKVVSVESRRTLEEIYLEGTGPQVLGPSA